MPKTANHKTPGIVLQSFIDKNEINPFIVSKALDVAYQSVTNILKGKARITVSMALRLAAYFGNTPQFWLDTQNTAEIEELTSDKKFMSAIKKIPKVQKTAAKEKKETKTKIGKRKLNTLAEKRKKALKTPGAKIPKGKKAGRLK